MVRTILIVDDSRAFQATVGLLLARAGYETQCADNGRVALDYLNGAADPPALILLDVHMPVMDGEAFRREQLQSARLRTIPVVLISADSDIGPRAERLRSPYLAKPVDGETLLAAVERYAARC
jgi:CheY-like chemotaxis protein